MALNDYDGDYFVTILFDDVQVHLIVIHQVKKGFQSFWVPRLAPEDYDGDYSSTIEFDGVQIEYQSTRGDEDLLGLRQDLRAGLHRFGEADGLDRRRDDVAELAGVDGGRDGGGRGDADAVAAGGGAPVAGRRRRRRRRDGLRVDERRRQVAQRRHRHLHQVRDALDRLRQLHLPRGEPKKCSKTLRFSSETIAWSTTTKWSSRRESWMSPCGQLTMKRGIELLWNTKRSTMK